MKQEKGRFTTETSKQDLQMPSGNKNQEKAQHLYLNFIS